MNVLTLAASFHRKSRPYLQGGLAHFFMYFFGRFRIVRSFMVWTYKRSGVQPVAAPAGLAQVEQVNVGEAVRSISQNGFYRGIRLRSETVDELLSFAATAPCFGEGKMDRPFVYLDKEIAERRLGQSFKRGVYNHAFVASPVLRALVSDPQLLAIARKYLGTEPAVIGARMWWSFACPADAEEQMEAGQGFHYDIDGYRALTFFFYLSSVGPLDGPHIYIRGSHRKKSLRHLISLHKGRSDADIERYYGTDKQVVFCGDPGSGFAEDIFGFHKGQHPESGARLIVQVRYGLHDYGTGKND